MKLLKIAALILLAGSQMLAASLKNEEECKALAEKVMKRVGSGEYEEAFDMVAEHWPLPKKEITKLSKTTKAQMTAVAQRFGPLVGSEFIRKDRIKNSYVRYVYLQKYENHATKWEVIFYKPKDVWLVNGVKWNDSVEDLFNLPSQSEAAE